MIERIIGMTVKDTLEMTVFPIIVQTDCKNIYRIYPLKQNIVAKLYEIGMRHKEISKIYIW